MLDAHDLELWRGERRLFAGVDLRVRPGEAVHVTGPNGIGKSSLLRVLAGLTRPETGDVRWNGRSIFREPDPFRTAITYLGHRDGLKNDLNATENLRFSMSLGSPGGASGAQIDACLQALGVLAVRHLPVRALSAGQRRRVAIGRSLLSGATLWILDEPFSNLDAAGREWGHACIAEHLERAGMALVTSHHPIRLAGRPMRELPLGAGPDHPMGEGR